MNCRSSVDTLLIRHQNRGGDVTSRAVRTIPAYGSGGVRHRGSVNMIRALMLNCGNLASDDKRKAQASVRPKVAMHWQGAERLVVAMKYL